MPNSHAGGGGGGMSGGAAAAKQRPQLENDVLQPKAAPAHPSTPDKQGGVTHTLPARLPCTCSGFLFPDTCVCVCVCVCLHPVPGIAHLHSPATRAASPAMAFENPLQGMMDGATQFFSQISGQQSKMSLEEMEELCRDEESSGCDVDMMNDLIAAESKKKNQKPTAAKPRWSAAIDDAVFKAD